MSVVEKHGSHNQKDHAGKTGGPATAVAERSTGSDLPSGWSKRSDEDVIAHWEKVAIEEWEAKPEDARKYAVTRAIGFEVYDGPNGSQVSIDRYAEIKPASRDRLLKQVTEMQGVAPNPGMKVEVGLSAYRYHNEDPSTTGGFAYLGRPNIFLAPRSVTQGFRDTDPEWLMPSVKGNRKAYPLAHEWAHTIDKRPPSKSFADWKAVSSMSGMSKYGRSNDRESFAEAFVEWHLTGGRTSSEAVAYYRETYNWGSEGGVTVAKAATQTVTIIADTFGPEGGIIREDVTLPSLVEWTLAQPARKSVVVAFASGLRPVLKHGNHDQKSHGRKGGTGRAEPVRSMSEMPPNIRRVAESFDAPTWSRFRDSCDRGGGCEDVAAAIEERFGVPQVTGTFTTKSGAKEYHSWNQDASGWIVDGGQDVFPSGQGDGSALMFFAPGASQYAVDSVAKHGSHNQASHNPHKGGAKDLPEGWSERSREAVRERQMSRFSQHYEDPSRVQEIADRVTDRTREFDGPNGTVVRVQFSDAAQQVDPAKMNEALGAIDTVQKLNPVKDLVVHFGDQPFRDEAAIIDGGALGFVIRGEKTINMRPGLVEKGVVTERPDSGHFMPSYESASPLTYYITHEYGHVLDRRSSGQQDDYALFQSGAINSVSEYGRTNGAETWAESYTEWALTGGRTSNPASQYFADKYFWADNLSEAAVKAVGERTIIVDTFSVLKDPEIITTVAKAVYVAFEPGLRPVLKHGSHDQSSHGRRGGGGSSLTLDAGVAQSIVERVRANGGLSVSMVDGSEPTEGFMVAKGGKQSAIVDADEFYDPVKGPEAMSSFLKENRELSEGAYLGLWHNQADGKVYLDVSENIMDRATAVQAGRERDQISIWDVANFEEIDTGGTGQVGKAVAGSETAGPVQDDRRGDRRVRKESVGESGGAVVVRFSPGLRPVLKHGSHNQQSHAGGRAVTGVPGQYMPPGGGSMKGRPQDDEPQSRRTEGRTSLADDYESQQDAIARALMHGDFDGLNIGPSRLAQRIGGTIGSTERKVVKFAERFGVKLSRNKRHTYTAEQAQALRESYYEKYGRPTWMQKAVAWLKGLFDE